VSEKFPIFEISPEAPEESEAMGTKEKFWFHHEQLGLCLYKKARQNTGEDWAEKIAAELCKLIQLPHAEYQLAIFNNEKGTISKSFFDAFCEAAKLYPQAAKIWLDSLGKISTENTLELFKRIPDNCISSTAIEFAQQILEINQNKLLEFSQDKR
jgi:hypothetical protein